MNIIRDPVDDLLKTDAARHRDHYIDDDGFTSRVAESLPARASLSIAARCAILGGATLLATLFVALFAGGGDFLMDAAMDIATSTMTQTAIAFLAMVAVLIAVSISLAGDR